MKRKYSDEEIINIALSCGSIVKLRRQNFKVYLLMYKWGLTEKIREITNDTRIIRYNDNDIIQTAINCGTMGNFFKNHRKKYNDAHYRKLMPIIREKLGLPLEGFKYNDERLREIASKCTTKKDFEITSIGAYSAAIKRGPYTDKNGNIIYYVKGNPLANYKGLINTHGFFNDICKHMLPMGNLNNRLIYVFKFYDDNGKNHSAYIGLTYNINKRNDGHFNDKKSTVGNFIKENPTFRYEQEILTDNFVTPDVAKRLEEEYIQKFKNEGWYILNIARSGGLGSGKKIKNEDLKKVTEKYNNVYDFVRKEPNVTRILCKRGLYKEYTQHMKKRIKEFKLYTEDEILSAAKECSSYKDFILKYRTTMYEQSRRRNRLQKIQDVFNYQKSIDYKLERQRYSDDDIISTALECGVYEMFRKQQKNIYELARKRKLLPIIKELLQKNVRPPQEV